MAKITGFGSSKPYQMDMCHGNLTVQIIKFTIPLIISGILQMLFHTADLIVIGRFSSGEALAAVGSTGALTQFLINIFIGLSIGTNVLVARYLGEHNRKDISRSVHTAILTSLGGGALLAVVGVILARPLLEKMGTPEEVLDMAVLYMQITFLGMPLTMLYNFGSAILRAMGDTTRPFYFLILGGVINIMLNLFFVIVCGMDVAGVAIATVASQGVAGILILQVLFKMRGPCRFKWQNLRFKWKNMREMLWIGIPAGFQSSCFSLSNILIQSAINTFGSAAMAGVTASNSLDIISYIGHTAITQAVISFVGQNYGGQKIDRVKKSIYICTIMVALWAIIVCMTMLTFKRPLLEIFNCDQEMMYYGIKKLYLVFPFIFICGIMEVHVGALRGLGKSVTPTVITLICVCVLRVIWIFAVFNPVRWNPDFTLDQAFIVLFACYPLTWILNTSGVGWLLWREIKKLNK